MNKENLDTFPKVRNYMGHFLASVAIKLYINNSRFFKKNLENS